MADLSVAPEPRLLVVGASGQVGGAILELAGTTAVASGRSPGHPLALDLGQLAIHPDRAQEVVSQARPTTVIISAAMTNVDLCEGDPDRAVAINTTAPAVLARAAHRGGARSVFISTEYVFDGKSGPYDETAEPRPLSVYGRTKAEGEQAVLAADPNALVVRTTVVYGPEPSGKNFAYRLARALSRGEDILVPADQVSTPTYNRDLAAAIIALARSALTGTFHIAGPTLQSRYRFALELAQAAGLPSELVLPVATSALAQTAPRPLAAGLVSGRPGPPGGPVMRGTATAVQDWRGAPSGLPWPTWP